MPVVSTSSTAPRPIIFTHYGYCRYLEHAFAFAAHRHQNKPVILIGDHANRRVAAKYGLEHVDLDDVPDTPELARFREVFRVIQGPRHHHIRNGRNWLEYVFLRWFKVDSLVQQRGYPGFWHFDTDTLILDRLADHEPRFEGIDLTEQCNGECINGFIANPQRITEYTRYINRLFEDDDFLSRQEHEFATEHPNFAFTEMRAYREFRRHQNDLKTCRIGAERDGIVFDDCICQQHGMEMERYRKKQIKAVYLHRDGRLYCRDEATGRAVRLASLNMSWVGLDLFETVSDWTLDRLDEPEEAEVVLEPEQTLARLAHRQRPRHWWWRLARRAGLRR